MIQMCAYRDLKCVTLHLRKINTNTEHEEHPDTKNIHYTHDRCLELLRFILSACKSSAKNENLNKSFGLHFVCIITLQNIIK